MSEGIEFEREKIFRNFFFEIVTTTTIS